MESVCGWRICFSWEGRGVCEDFHVKQRGAQQKILGTTGLSHLFLTLNSRQNFTNRYRPIAAGCLIFLYIYYQRVAPKSSEQNSHHNLTCINYKIWSNKYKPLGGHQLSYKSSNRAEVRMRFLQFKKNKKRVLCATFSLTQIGFPVRSE